MLKIFKKLTQPILLHHWAQDLAIALPRIVYGYFLTANFGASKFGMPWSPADKNLGLFEVAFWFPADVAAYGGVFAQASVFLAWMAAFSEAVGGLAWIFGFQTRLFSFLIFCTMLVVVFVHQIQYGLWNMLPGMGILWVALLGMVMGSGRFGLDYLISKKLKITMKNLSIIIVSILLLNSCVQKSYEQIVEITVDVSGLGQIKSVGIRGEEKPLSWDNDYPMKEIVKDSLYSVSISGKTGYLQTEVKFVVNGEFELKDKPNRKIVFDPSRKTIFKAKFNQL
jgi:putative oxidoreductase